MIIGKCVFISSILIVYQTHNGTTMIEAVNAVIANAPLLRGNAEQVAVANAADQIETVSTAPQAPYISPYIYMDVNLDKAVLQIRDSETGDVLSQFPAKQAYAQQRRANTPSVPEGSQFSSNNAQAQVAAAALEKGAQASSAQTTTVVTEA